MNTDYIWKLCEKDLENNSVKNAFLKWLENLPYDREYMNHQDISDDDFTAFLTDRLTYAGKIERATNCFKHMVDLQEQYEKNDPDAHVIWSEVINILNLKDKIFLEQERITKEIYLDTVSDRIIKQVDAIYGKDSYRSYDKRPLNYVEISKLRLLAKLYLHEGKYGSNDIFYLLSDVAEMLTKPSSCRCMCSSDRDEAKRACELYNTTLAHGASELYDIFRK